MCPFDELNYKYVIVTQNVEKNNNKNNNNT